MKYIFSVFCVLFGLTSSWADDVDFYCSGGLSQKTFKDLCGTGAFPNAKYLSCDHMEFKGYKCQKAGDFVKVVVNDENSKCGVVSDCVEGDNRLTYITTWEVPYSGSNVGFFGCLYSTFYEDYRWYNLIVDTSRTHCQDGDDNECYDIGFEDCEYKCFDSNGYLYTTECPSDGQEEVVEIEDNASATVGDAGATEGGEVVEAAIDEGSDNVVVNASEIVEKLKPYNLLKRSAWVNKDGKFNTTRLLVDTGAGAVLGTVGGVIANKVIRKNQISSGMDGYQCVVNGQTVAEYGDDFVIDIYR